MRAAHYTGEGRIELSETDQPVAPGAGQVQLEVAYVGICGTDLHVLHGAMDARVGTNAVIGHEASAVVRALGTDVIGWQVGDRVTVMPLVWDGDCPACRAGHQHICQHLDFVGLDSPGALQERWTVAASLLVALPEGLPLTHGALVEPVAVAVHDVRRGEVGAGDKVLVLGGGPIGALIGLVAQHEGADVLVSEPDADRRATLVELGLTTVDPVGEDVEAHVQEWTGSAGADVVFEVSGAARAVATAIANAKVRGTVVVVAIHPQPALVDLKQVFWRELRILGARVYQRTDFERAVELLAAGVVPADQVISGVVPLDRTADAFATLGSGAAMKVLVELAP